MPSDLPEPTETKQKAAADQAQHDTFASTELPAADDRERRLLGELVKKAVSTGINTMLSTEEGVRAVVDAVAQKDIIGSAVNGVDATRKEAMSLVGREVGSFLDNLNLSEEIAKILTSVSFEIRTEVRFIPNEDGKLRAKVSGGAKPKVKIRSDREQSQEDNSGEDADGRSRAPGSAAEEHAPDDDFADDPVRTSTREMATRAVRGIVERFAEATATTARAAAEVAADAAADVVNEARRAADDSGEGLKPDGFDG